MVWALLLLLELARLVLVRLLLRHLLIPSLGTGFSTILLPHDVFSLLFFFLFGALYFGRPFCIGMGCTDIDYCIYDICGLWMALVFFYVYGHVYRCMFMDVCLWTCLGMCLGLCLGSYLWLRVWVSGLDPPRGLV